MSCRRRTGFPLAFCLAVGGLAGCGEPSEEIVAVVGEVKISLGDVERFAARLDKALRSKESGDAARREYVDALVGEELLVVEGRARRLDREPGFEDDLERRFRQKVVSNYHRDRLGPAVRVSYEEVREEFVSRGYNRLKELSRIVVATLEEAEDLHRKLQQGARFDSLARVHSLDRSTAPQGGLLGRITWPEAQRAGIPQYVFTALSPGELSSPVELAEVYQLVRSAWEGEGDIAPYRAQLHRELVREKFAIAHKALVESLKVVLDLQPKPGSLDLLIAKAPGEGLTEKEAATPLYTYTGGTITAGDYIRIFELADKPPALGDSARVVGATRKVAANALIWQAARDAGYATREEMLSWRQRKKRDLLIQALRRIEAIEKIVVTDVEVKQYYEEHPGDFRRPTQVWLDEILVETREEAGEVRRRLEAGETFADLAALTLRGEGTELHLHSYEAPLYGDLVPEAAAAPLGQLVGPLKVQGGYSVFRVKERSGGEQRSLEEEAPRIRGILNMIRREELFNGYIEELKVRYAGEIRIDEEAISRIRLPGKG